jgi:hypothetical protein
MKCAVLAASTALVILLVVETAVRLGGLTDFPLYVRSPGVSYSLQPNQRGAFLRRNAWFVNDAGFNNPEPFRASSDTCALLGDSVVYGGNPVDYANRVGTIAGHLLGHSVWVGAAGGWSLSNELAFVKGHQAAFDRIGKTVIVLNNGDFASAAPWGGELAQPTYHPWLASLYLTKRYVLPHASELPPISDGTEADRQTLAQPLVDLVQHARHAPAFILYSDAASLTNSGKWAAIISYLEAIGRRSGRAITIIDSRRVWAPAFYRDTIHPNSRGNKVLATLVAKACRQ